MVRKGSSHTDEAKELIRAKLTGMVSPKRNNLEKIFARTMIVGDCRVWQGYSENGYGKTMYCGKSWLVHRLVWTFINGEIPAGMTLDHLCKNRGCCEVTHLEVVTQAENVRRGSSPSQTNKLKMYCKRGHPLFGDNVKVTSKQRVCLECARTYSDRRKSGN